MNLTGMTALKTTSRMSQVHISCLNTGHQIKASIYPLTGTGIQSYLEKEQIFTHLSKKLQKTTDRYSETQVCISKGKFYPSHHNSLDITSEPSSERIWYCNYSKDCDCKDDLQVSTEEGTWQGFTMGLKCQNDTRIVTVIQIKLNSQYWE